jgi:aerobic C4-dicarboxylate transport protein
VLIGAWTQSMDHRQMQQVLDGDKPFDERTMVDEEEQEEAPPPGGREPAAAGH